MCGCVVCGTEIAPARLVTGGMVLRLRLSLSLSPSLLLSLLSLSLPPLALSLSCAAWLPLAVCGAQ
eukprot:2939505-Rhodomonas_salina.1